MADKKSRSSGTFPGVLLIGIGALFLLGKADIISFSWPLILVVLGVAFLAKAVIERNDDFVFPGALLFLLGLAFIAIRSRWMPGWYGSDWPLLLVAIGAAFVIVSFVRQNRGNDALVLGIIIIGAGVLFLLVERRVIPGCRIGDLLGWWPLALVAFGLYLLLARRRN